MFGALVVIIAFVGAGVVGSLSAMAGQLYERRKWERRMLRHAGLVVDETDRESSRESSREADRDQASFGGDSRMTRLEQAVDAIAIEMERIGEGQRFVTKLLAERTPDRKPDRDRNSGRTPPSPIPGAVRSTSRPGA